jgi:hypothetical protein
MAPKAHDVYILQSLLPILGLHNDFVAFHGMCMLFARWKPGEFCIFMPSGMTKK